MANLINPRDVPQSHLPNLQTFNPHEPYEVAKSRFDSYCKQLYGCTMQYTEMGPQWAMKGPLGAFFAVGVVCPNHPFGKPVIACGHCHEQDPVHPEGIVLSDSGFYACKTCWDRITMHKWRYWDVMTLQCHHCIKATVDRLLATDPTKFTDYMKTTLLKG